MSLTDDQRAKLEDLLQNESATLKAIGKQFESDFSGEELGVVLALHALPEPAHPVDAHIQRIVSVYILHLITKGKSKGQSLASPPTAAKATLNNIFQHLELNLREDSKRAEQWRMRANAKDGAVSKSKTGGKDAGMADAMRFRMATKALGFQALLNKVPLDTTPLKILSQTQTEIDAVLDGFSTRHGSELKEALKDLQYTAENERLTSFGSLSSKAVSRPLEGGSKFVYPAFCLPLPHTDATNVKHKEYHLALAPSLTTIALLETDPLSKEAKQLMQLVSTARAGALNQTQQTQLVNSISTDNEKLMATSVGLSPAAMAEIARRNPLTVAQLITKVPSPHAYAIAVLADPDVEVVTLNGIMSPLASGVTQPLVNKYIAAVTKKLTSTADKEKAVAVSGFAVTLQQLVVRDQAELFAPADKAAAAAVFKENKDLPDVAALWASLISD